MDPTLNETLAALGLTKRPADKRFWDAYSWDILKDGIVVFTGDAYQTFHWLHERGLLA